jgi:hypothetical protein
MALNLYRIILLSAAVTVSTMTADAQLRIIPKEKIDNVADPRHSKDSAALEFDTRYMVAQPMNEDDAPSTYVFHFKNVSDAPVIIDRLMTTCSCATAKADRNKVMPGEKAEIAVRYNPKGHPGKFERRVFVYTSAGNDPAAVLRLSVEVEKGADMSGEWPVQMGTIRLRRSEASFVNGQKAVEKLRFINLSGRPLRLECEDAFLPECLTFRTHPQTVEDGQEGEIIISYDPTKSGEREQMKVILKGLGVQPSRSSITVHCRP